MRLKLFATNAFALCMIGAAPVLGQGMPAGGRPLSRAEVATRDAALQADIARLSKRQGVTEAALRKFISQSGKTDIGALRGELESFADQLTEFQVQIDVLRGQIDAMKAGDRAVAQQSIESAQAALLEGQIGDVGNLLAAYEALQAKRFDDDMWRQVTDRLQASPPLSLEERRALVESYIVDHAYGQHKAEANAWLARLEAERLSVVRTTPWLAGAAMRVIDGGSQGLLAVTFGPDSSWLVTGGRDGSLRTWNSKTGQAVKTLVSAPTPVVTLSLSPDGRYAVAGHEDGKLRVWDLRAGKVRHVLTGHWQPVTGVAWSHDGGRIASASRDTSVKLWDAVSGALIKDLVAPHPCAVPSPRSKDLRSRNVSAEMASCARYTVNRGTVSDVEFSTNDSQVIVAHLTEILVVDVATGVLRARLSGKAATARFWPDGKRYATIDPSGFARLWNARSNREACTVDLPGASRGQNGAVSRDGQHWAVATDDNLVVVINAACETLVELEGHGSPAKAVAFAPDGHTLASVAEDDRLILWQDQSVRR